eukprot:6648004-Prymnesium_polylepis.1
MFGFETWDDAMAMYAEVQEWRVEVDGGKPDMMHKSILIPRFQYLSALWRMRMRKDMDELG